MKPDVGEVPGRRSRTRLAAGVIAIALSASITACSGGSSSPGVASAGTPKPSASSSSKGSSGDALAYSQCMRSHGVTNFPDPNSQGVVSGSFQNGITPQFQAAQQACAHLLPASTGPAAGQQAQNDAEALKYSACMRTHGFPQFPDPSSNGAISISSSGSSSNGIDPNSPQYQAASKTCGKLSGFVAVNGGSGS